MPRRALSKMIKRRSNVLVHVLDDGPVRKPRGCDVLCAVKHQLFCRCFSEACGVEGLVHGLALITADTACALPAMAWSWGGLCRKGSSPCERFI